MAKVPFSKLQASVNNKEIQVAYANKTGEEIKYDVKYYLPFKEKIELVSRIINQSLDDNGFYNPMRVKLFLTLETVYAYTNLNFTDKMKEDPFKLYDILISTGIFKNIINVISPEDWEEIVNSVWETIDNIYQYRNSAMGIMEAISTDYSALEMDAKNISDSLSNKENLQLLREVLTKMG